MFLKQISRLRHYLKIKLTLWYTGVLTLTLLVALFFLYSSVENYFIKSKDTAIRNEYKEFQIIFEEGGIPAVQREAILESGTEGVENVFFRLLTPEGQPVAQSNMANWESLTAPDPSMIAQLNGAPYQIVTILVPGHHHHIRILTGPIGTDYVMQIGHSLKYDERFLHDLKDIFVVLAAAAVLAGIVCGGFISWKATAGINDITSASRIIAQGQFDTRVPTQNMKGDVENLAVAFNTMLDRIQALVAGMQEVTDNIAHDLRSPIARIRAAAELALHDVKDPEEYTEVMAHTISECDRLLSLVETMLFISEIEAGTRPSRKENVDLAFLVHEACDLFQPLAEDKRIALSVQQSTPTCHIAGEPASLQRLIANLLDNALKYTEKGGRVTVRLEALKNEAILVFEDNGIGISPENLPHIFDRFYRCDKSRHQSGTGLGLNLARAIALEHDGDIHVSSRYGHGTLVTVRLPQARITS
ncbi:MAG: HAMP domain-containing protein [Deltaproteobacteria bacterium]|nr:HAMP domain-containing protein [Deltaproteobacteria bacterium]